MPRDSPSSGFCAARRTLTTETKGQTQCVLVAQSGTAYRLRFTSNLSVRGRSLSVMSSQFVMREIVYKAMESHQPMYRPRIGLAAYAVGVDNHGSEMVEWHRLAIDVHLRLVIGMRLS